MRYKVVSIVMVFILFFTFFTFKIANASSLENNTEKYLLQEHLIDANSVIVRYKPFVCDYDIKLFENKFKLKNRDILYKDLSVHSYNLPDNEEVNSQLLDEMNKSTIVLYAEPNYKYNMCVEPYYNLEWGLKNSSYCGIDIDVESAWSLTKGRSSVVVAIIDSGIDYVHPDLKNNIWKNTKEIPNNKIDDDKNGYVDDVIGWNFYSENNLPYDDLSHGTHISGIIAASENNYGIIGVAPNVKLMPLKIFGKNRDVANFSDIIRAVIYASENGASIVNMSFVGRGYSKALYDIMNAHKDMLFVCAAGNNALNIDLVSYYPASYILPNSTTVTSINQNGSLSSFSNYGVKTVDVAAPGFNILSTYPNNKFAYNSGTSMAAPFATGLAALIKSYRQNLSPSEIVKIIEGNTRQLQSLKGKIKTGGLIDAGKALRSIK